MHVADHSVAHPQGFLFARSWTPGDPGRDAGPTILLFHDSLGCVELWRDFPGRLAERTGRRVVAYDRLGFGRSATSPAATPLDPGFIADEATISVPALDAALGLGHLVPLGHSVGGAMAVATAAAYPDRCPAVVTIASQAFVEDRTAEGIRTAQEVFRDPQQVERLARYHGDKAAWVLAAWIETWLAPPFSGWTQDDTLRRLRCPLLALHGDRDEYGSLLHPRRLAETAGGGGRAVTLADCGHVPHRERPDEVLAHVAGMLDART